MDVSLDRPTVYVLRTVWSNTHTGLDVCNCCKVRPWLDIRQQFFHVFRHVQPSVARVLKEFYFTRGYLKTLDREWAELCVNHQIDFVSSQ